MRALVSVMFIQVLLSAAAHAQPAPAQPAPAEDMSAAPGAYPPPPPGVGAPAPAPTDPYPPYGNAPADPYPPPPPYGPPLPLTADEQRLLALGEISSGQHLGGVALDWFVGFGLGQAVQGRWSDTGWMFALGEAAGITALIVGFSQLCFDCEGTTRSNDRAGALMLSGLIAYGVTHVWSIVDAAIAPPEHNRKVRALRYRLGLPLAARIVPFASPAPGAGGTAGLALRF